MVDRPKLNPQVFAKRGGGTPTLTAQVASLRGTPSVSNFAADSVADTYLSFADDASRLQQLENGQFAFNQQQFEVAQAEVEEQQLIEAEAEYNKIILQSEQAIQQARLNSDVDEVVDDSIGAYEQVQQRILENANLSAFQREHLSPKLDDVKTSVARSAFNFQRTARAEESRNTVAEGVKAREFIANAHPDQLEELLEEADATIDRIAFNLPASERAELKQKQKVRLTLAAAQGEISKNPGLSLEKITSGAYNNTLTLRQVQALQSDAEVGVRKQQAELDKIESARRSALDADLGVAISVGPLETLPTQTELDNQRETGAITDAQWEQHTKARVKRLQAVQAENEDLRLGMTILENKIPVNPENKDAVKAFNTAYENSQDQIAAMPVEQRIRYSVDLIRNHRAVPDLMKGEMKIAARSGDPEQVRVAADIVDQLSAEAPYLMGQLINDKDRQRIDMINRRLNIGATQQEAITQTDQQLSILNQASNESISDELTQLTQDIDFRAEASDVFAGAFDFLPFVGGTNDEGLAAFDLDRASAVARLAYEDAYRRTRDPEIAEKKMQEAVSGRFGRTSVNGTAMTMEFPPENYYSIEGEPNGWMREQMLEAAREVTAGDFKTGSSVEDRVMLLPDPFLTPKLAEQGRPGYNIVLMGEDGTPRQLNPQGQLFFFDPAARRQQLVDEAQEPSTFESILNSVGLGGE